MKLQDYEREHIAAMRKLAPECMVLLKCKGDFPLEKPGSVALYGSGARKTVKGGSGSGDVYSHICPTVENALEAAGFTITTKKWLDAYDNCHKSARKDFVRSIKIQAKAAHKQAILVAMGAVMAEPEYELPLDGEGDTAIYILARSSGEGSDRRAVQGDFRLTNTEIRDILTCQKKYKHFMLVLNTGGVVDLSPVMEVENILLLSQLGAATGDAFADVLLGRAYPSGRLTATWSREEDYQSVGNFGDPDDTRYREGIYVGYRYFNSIGVKPLFPFGYGLGYTVFESAFSGAEVIGNRISVTVNVANRGSAAGKEVVQLYMSSPEGALDKEYQSLVGYAKTKELLPGEEERLLISFRISDFAAYDTARAAYVLEAGIYKLRLGKDSEHTAICAMLSLEESVIVRQLTNIGGDVDFTDWKPSATDCCERGEQERGKDTGHIPVFRIDKDCLTGLVHPKPEQLDESVQSIVSKLSDEQLSRICVGRYKGDGSDATVIGSASQEIPGAAGETCRSLPEIPGIVMADGPAGLRLLTRYTMDDKGKHGLMDELPGGIDVFLPVPIRILLAFLSRKKPKGTVYYQYSTALPVGTAIAQSWNLSLAQRCGDVVAEEMERFGVSLWLAPAFNIQRNPLCGRNFEYYSEDPLLSGQMGAAVVKGVESHKGCGTTVKHYCCNNQETNRAQSNSIVSERALREIYLKPFEICIRESNPLSLMTSNNLLNGVHTSERKDILQTVLRQEWGYTGLVMTDWMIASTEDKSCRYRYARAAMAVKAGNDLYMPGSRQDMEDILTALQGTNPDVRISREEAEFCGYHVVYNAKKLLGQKEDL